MARLEQTHKSLDARPAAESLGHESSQELNQTIMSPDKYGSTLANGSDGIESLSLRLNDLLGPVTRVKKKKIEWNQTRTTNRFNHSNMVGVRSTAPFCEDVVELAPIGPEISGLGETQSNYHVTGCASCIGVTRARKYARTQSNHHVSG